MRTAIGAMLLGLTCFLGCGGDDAAPRRDVTPTPLDLSSVGTIRASVHVKGKIPPARELNLRSSPVCAAAHDGPVMDRSLIVNQGSVQNAVVFIKSGLGDRVFASPTEPVLINQKGCIYEPRVVAAMIGQPIEFKNSDPEPHNVHGKPETTKPWNFLMSRQGASRTITIGRPEVAIKIACDIHPWMVSYVATFEHPYFGVTAADGSTTLEKVPPGKYVVAVWHEVLGTLEKSIELAERGSQTVDFTYEAP